MLRVDLHVHTPISTCYADKTVKIEQLVGAAVKAGLDAVAVTDHHAVRGAIELREVSKGTRLSVMPGIEITLKDGHFLALFDVDAGASELVSFLDWLGIPTDKQGDGHFAVAHDVESVLRQVDDRGGIAIAAHIERWPSGFLESREPRAIKQSIHASQYLSALEITIPEDKAAWNEGLVRGFPKKYACVQASDSHSLSDIGRRQVLLDVERFDLNHLRIAISEHARRISFPGARVV